MCKSDAHRGQLQTGIRRVESDAEFLVVVDNAVAWGWNYIFFSIFRIMQEVLLSKIKIMFEKW